jgi:hypothetical protein
VDKKLTEPFLTTLITADIHPELMVLGEIQQFQGNIHRALLCDAPFVIQLCNVWELLGKLSIGDSLMAY